MNAETCFLMALRIQTCLRVRAASTTTRLYELDMAEKDVFMRLTSHVLNSRYPFLHIREGRCGELVRVARVLVSPYLRYRATRCDDPRVQYRREVPQR